ncbi:MAG: biotin--[acetyl-CoA-carboxylase] ligase [Eubacteriales bacterium]|nr:biotin--[acetyl-CoA-carboxylase] ligase [Eubacteriales bacterium]
MTTKEQILTLLEDRQGSFVSGEELAESLNLSRAAVCKAIKALRQEGFPIEAVTNRGYRLSGEYDILSAQGVKKHLNREFQVSFSPSVDSTNAVLRSMAEQGAAEGTVVIANAQTNGRGRRGRSFYSPADTGIYLSLLLRPVNSDPRQTVTLTAAAAVALCQAMEAVSGAVPEIKWVNDIFLDGKKISGILTEAAFGLESGAPEYVVVGVGINAYTPEGGFPAELSEIAGALWDKTVPDGKNRLAAEFLNRFWALYAAGDPSAFLEDYRRRSLVVGKDITVIAGDTETPAHAVGIDDSCRLLVRYENGETAALSYGEVCIRAM